MKSDGPGGLSHRMTASLLHQHRAIEQHLDLLIAAIGAATPLVDAFRQAHRLAAEHYRDEESFLARLPPAVAAKIAAQHAEALEIAAQLEASLAAGQMADALFLARRFHAIAQHNIIEEERDVFPLAEDCFES